MPQDHRRYLPQRGADALLLPEGMQSVEQNRYIRFFFLPWHERQLLYSRADVEELFSRYLDKSEKSKNSVRPGKSFVKALKRNAALKSYPNAGLRAITVCRADVRGLPTSRSFRASSNGHFRRSAPFDRIQVSSIPANTPANIVHWSRNKKWCLVETGSVFGWMAARNLALVDDAFIEVWERGAYIAFLRDGIPVGNKKRPFFHASVGSLFPKAGEKEGCWQILVAVMGKNRQAVIRRISASKTIARITPLPLNRQNIAELANTLTDNPYGWGGKEGMRDCSSMIRDLYAPFGLWLPRHSADQAMEGGRFTDLSAKNRDEKRNVVLSQGIPYMTLLWIRGHIMIYIGSKDGEPLVFHNLWSVRTVDAQGRSGKKIVGRSAVTTLHPGKEFLPSGADHGSLLDAIQGMTTLPPSASPDA